MSLNDGVWKLWPSLGFCQRLGVLRQWQDDQGAWHGSAEGSPWKHDFGLDYVRPR